MFNVAVINIKEILKYLVSITITFAVVMLITRYFSNLEEKNQISEITQNSLLVCLDEIIPGIKETNHEINNQEEDIINQNTILGRLLKVELSMFKEEQKIADLQNATTNHIDEIYPDNEENIILENSNTEISEGETEVVTQNPLAENYNVDYQGVKIKNETSFELTEDILSQKTEVNKENIVIFHTHTCESYTSSENYPYEPTGNYRTTDTNYSVVKVGENLKQYLQGYGYTVTHTSTYHDYPAYSGSYNRSLSTVENILTTCGSDIIIDIHRDAIGSRADYAPTVRIGEEYVAQLMFVIGTNGGGLWHPNWKQNLQFALEVQSKANELYPGLFKPIILRNSRYNQHLGKAACIIEVGATGNTLEQSLTSMKYLAKVLNEVLK